MRRVGILATCLVLCAGLLLPAQTTNAEDAQPKNKGLYVTPVREYIDVKPGETRSKKITIANITDSAVVIDMSVEQFSVTDYSYDFNFRPAKDSWVTLGAVQLRLDANKSQTVDYTVAPPTNATPGGHYFSIFATSTIQNGNIKSQVQATTVLYVAVQGLLKMSSVIQNADIPQISFGEDIPFSIDVKNTGNTHFFIYVSGNVSGLLTKKTGPESTRLLLPGAVRTFGGHIPAPLLPGIYTATYGYTTDTGATVQRNTRIIYVPAWSIITFIGALWVATTLALRHYKQKARGSLRP